MSLPQIPKEYLEQIDCLQPDSGLETILEFEPLQRWAAQSEQHRKAVELAVEKSRQLDRRLQQLMPDVVVPGDLQQRLIAATASHGQPPRDAVTPVSITHQRAGSRRLSIALYGASLAMLV